MVAQGRKPVGRKAKTGCPCCCLLVAARSHHLLLVATVGCGGGGEVVAVGSGTRGWAWLCRQLWVGGVGRERRGKRGIGNRGFCMREKGCVGLFVVKWIFIFSFDPLNFIKVVSS